MLRTVLYSLMFLFLLSGTLTAQNFTPDIVVAPDGSGDFTKIQAAIDAVPNNSSLQTIIYIKRGVYDTEKLIVPANKTNVVLIGESRDETVLSYHIYDCTGSGFNGKCPAEDAMLWSGDNILTSATLTIIGDGFVAENLTIRNTAGPVGQAQAITVRADKVVFRNCNLSSYQDTIYFWSQAKRTYMENCLIIGRTDYIYGSGTAFFQECEIRSWGGGWITAPSTGQNQPHGFVFNKCTLSYALNSPRPGDDGALVALGRPWHNYPKVAWLYCNMTEKINPLGWPDKWNMSYADTSADLHLYEYMNTGPGSDMSGRANWVGIRSLTPAEAANYTVQAVLNGTDGWDPTAQPPLVTIYNWTGAGANSGWLLAQNWSPIAVPDTAEAAHVEGAYTITADGGQFVADLSLADGANLNVTAPSQVTLLTVNNAQLSGTGTVSLTGRIRTKDNLQLNSAGDFSLVAEIIGVHTIDKAGTGTVLLKGQSPDFAGYWSVTQGSLNAAVANALGKAREVQVGNTGTLIIDNADAYFVETPLFVEQGGALVLNADVVLSEFYIDGAIQSVGEYSASTNPGLISGSGKIIVGRPDTFTFIGGATGNWDNPAHFVPALLPEAGETVFSSIEMETTSFVFPADIRLEAPGGRIRMRGVHSATGTIFMETGTSIGYATSGAGFTLDAPIALSGDIQLNMNSKITTEHIMSLGGPISGSGKITAFNTRTDTKNTAIVELSGDNNGFAGTWDATLPGGHANSITIFQGGSANAFGHGLIEVGDDNLVALGHEKCAGDTLRVNLSGNGRIRLDTDVFVRQAVFNGTLLANGTYTASSHPSFFTGSGKLMVDASTSVLDKDANEQLVYAANNHLYVRGGKSCITIYHTDGRLVMNNNKAKEIALDVLPRGIYLVCYTIDGKKGTQKIVVE